MPDRREPNLSTKQHQELLIPETFGIRSNENGLSIGVGVRLWSRLYQELQMRVMDTSYSIGTDPYIYRTARDISVVGIDVNTGALKLALDLEWLNLGPAPRGKSSDPRAILSRTSNRLEVALSFAASPTGFSSSIRVLNPANAEYGLGSMLSKSHQWVPSEVDLARAPLGLPLAQANAMEIFFKDFQHVKHLKGTRALSLTYESEIIWFNWMVDTTAGKRIREHFEELSHMMPSLVSSAVTKNHVSTYSFGILAFGSLLGDPGAELVPLIKDRMIIRSPIKVEYARLSERTRGGAPTLVPYSGGAFVTAQVIKLDDTVSLEEAQHMLWRRETGKIGLQERYTRRNGKNCVLIDTTAFDDMKLLYVNFNKEGKEEVVSPPDLAKHAIESVRKAPPGKDGISYLANAINCGVITPLTEQYVFEILRQTSTSNLNDALSACRKNNHFAAFG